MSYEFAADLAVWVSHNSLAVFLMLIGLLSLAWIVRP